MLKALDIQQKLWYCVVLTGEVILKRVYLKMEEKESDGKKEKKVTRIDPVRTTQPLEQTQENEFVHIAGSAQILKIRSIRWKLKWHTTVGSLESETTGFFQVSMRMRTGAEQS